MLKKGNYRNINIIFVSIINKNGYDGQYREINHQCSFRKNETCI